MIIIGTKAYLSTVKRLTMICWSCHHPAAHRLNEKLVKLTVFFIPLFPISRRYTLDCVFCGVTQELAKDVARQIKSHGRVVEAAG